MFTVVIVLNVLVALLCWYAVWRVCKLRRSLTKIADALIVAERVTHAVLRNAPSSTDQGQLSIYQLRQRYQQLEPQLRQAQQVLALLSLGQSIWQRRLPLSRRPVTSRRRLK